MLTWDGDDGYVNYGDDGSYCGYVVDGVDSCGGVGCIDMKMTVV